MISRFQFIVTSHCMQTIPWYVCIHACVRAKYMYVTTFVFNTQFMVTNPIIPCDLRITNVLILCIMNFVIMVKTTPHNISHSCTHTYTQTHCTIRVDVQILFCNLETRSGIHVETPPPPPPPPPIPLQQCIHNIHNQHTCSLCCLCVSVRVHTKAPYTYCLQGHPTRIRCVAMLDLPPLYLMSPSSTWDIACTHIR